MILKPPFSFKEQKYANEEFLCSLTVLRDRILNVRKTGTDHWKRDLMFFSLSAV